MQSREKDFWLPAHDQPIDSEVTAVKVVKSSTEQSAVRGARHRWRTGSVGHWYVDCWIMRSNKKSVRKKKKGAKSFKKKTTSLDQVTGDKFIDNIFSFIT